MLSLRTIELIGHDHLDALSGQEPIKTVTVVDFITDDSCRLGLRKHEIKELLHEMAPIVTLLALSGSGSRLLR